VVTEQAARRPIGTGRSADVFDIGGGRVLRSYRDGRPAEWVAREAEVMAHARAHGVPVPEVFEVSGVDIVMERLSGPTMLDVLTSHPWLLWSHARLLARLHARVHEVPALPWLRKPFGTEPQPGPAEADSVSAASPSAETDMVPVLLHCDLHPQNVILTSRGPRLIDWEGAAQGSPAADIAMTWAIVAFSDVPGSPAEALVGHVFQGLFGRAFLHAAGLAPGSRSGPAGREWLAAGITNRLGDPHLHETETTRLRQALRRLG
jgi:aminoglycoside phosphotransferase (APT) family kinase protein